MKSQARSTLVLFLFLPVVVGLACDPDDSIPSSAYRLQGRPGFAIWPENQPEDALEACRDREGSESWRTDPDDVAQRFVTTVLSWPEGDEYDQYEADSGGLPTKTMVDPSMPRWSLGVSVLMRRLDDCFFVASVAPRDIDDPAVVTFVEQGRGAWVVKWMGRGPGVVELGHGRDVRRVILDRGEQARFPIPDADELGHFLAYARDQPNELVVGRPLGLSRHN